MKKRYVVLLVLVLVLLTIAVCTYLRIYHPRETMLWAAEWGCTPIAWIWDVTGVNLSGPPAYEALQIAAAKGHTGVVKAMLECPVDGYVEEELIIRRAFETAAREGHLDTVEVLLDCCPYRRALNGARDFAAHAGYIEVEMMVLSKLEELEEED
jgi:hypothetical protein